MGADFVIHRLMNPIALGPIWQSAPLRGQTVGSCHRECKWLETVMALKKKSGTKTRHAASSLFFRAIIHGMRFGPGKADLLEWIEKTGSLAEAARRMEMSYMRAWTLLKEIQTNLRSPAVILTRGGGRQGGAQLTPTGRSLLGAYRNLETTLQTNAAKPLRKLAGYFATPSDDESGNG